MKQNNKKIYKEETKTITPMHRKSGPSPSSMTVKRELEDYGGTDLWNRWVLNLE